ncbi:MAG: hypothetical protein GEV05_06875 [Betaproteobacteria bacterium]|nr:hypothetical protein [Betaproteobacteria bacterium]
MTVDRSTVVECALPTCRQKCYRRIARTLGCALLCWLLVPTPALGQTILGAEYDASSDALVIAIAYQGTNPNHDFALTWDKCEPTGGGHSVVARLIDHQGKDTAQKDYQVSRRFELSALECRPAEVMVRLGPVSNRTVSVPARGR